MKDQVLTRQSGKRRRSTCLLAAALLLFLLRGLAQTPETISGTVVDAVTNQPIFRALVRLTGQAVPRAALTDSTGHFSFTEVDTAQITLTAQKPGYHFGHNPNDPTQVQIKTADASAPVQIRLYPEALLSGTILDPDGTPLPHISVEALRANDDDLGRHWVATSGHAIERSWAVSIAGAGRRLQAPDGSFA